MPGRPARLLHLNGPPGIGKSTLARRWAADHPGTLCCDVDVLRTMISGWRDDFVRAGALVRPAAQAMIEAYLASGHDVVLPQLLADADELARFDALAGRAGAEVVEVFLLDESDDAEAALGRFARRGGADPDPWHDHVRRLVAADGGDDALREWHRRLIALLARRPLAVVVRTREGEVEAAYDALVAAVGGRFGGPPTMEP